MKKNLYNLYIYIKKKLGGGVIFKSCIIENVCSLLLLVISEMWIQMKPFARAREIERIILLFAVKYKRKEKIYVAHHMYIYYMTKKKN